MSGDVDFSFAKHAADFDHHIGSSIRGYADLRADARSFSQYFIQKSSRVVDIGCSSGQFLRSVRDFNQKRYNSVRYVGYDVEDGFSGSWRKYRQSNVGFRKADVRSTEDAFKNTSVVFSLFTLQFLPEKDRLPLVRRIYEGLNEGGAFILSEKVQAKNAKFQEMLTFIYYDFKKKNFSEQEILDKEQSIRDQMKLWSEYKIFEMLRSAGFAGVNLQLFWRNHLFIGIIASKAAQYR
jgi:tRNA (cmo5U34)-methyltransferase